MFIFLLSAEVKSDERWSLETDLRCVLMPELNAVRHNQDVSEYKYLLMVIITFLNLFP